MKKIYIFEDGSAILNDSDTPDQASINGKEPTQVLDATDENIQQYFGNITPPTVKI